MTDNVTVLRNDAGKADVVEMLEQLVERAKNGEFMCIAFAGLTVDAAITTGWTPPPKGRHSGLTGAVSYLEFRLNVSMEQV